MCHAARALLNWTLKELGAEAGVSQWSIMKFEQGRKQPAATTIGALRRALMKAGVIFLNPVRDQGSGVKLSRAVEALLERRLIGSSRTPPETPTPAICRAGRALLGWSQRELAAESGVDDTTIATFESGRHTLIAATAGALRRCLTDHGVIFVEAVGKEGRGVRLSRSAKERVDREDGGQSMTPVTCCAARALLGWTRDDLAAAADVSKSTVQMFERGEQALIRSTADAIRGCLTERGVIFVEPVGEGGNGVRLSRSVEGLREVNGSSPMTPVICRAARALLGWSFDELAVEAGVQRRNLLAIESGQEPALSTPAKAVRRALTKAGVIFLKPVRAGGSGVKLSRSAEALRDLLVRGTWKRPKERADCGALRDRVAAEIRRRERVCGPEGAPPSRRQQLRRKFEATSKLLERVAEFL